MTQEIREYESVFEGKRYATVVMKGRQNCFCLPLSRGIRVYFETKVPLYSFFFKRAPAAVQSTHTSPCPQLFYHIQLSYMVEDKFS